MDINTGERKCDNCKTIQVICKENEKTTRKLFLQCNGEKVSVCANSEMLEKISEGKGLDAGSLLFARPFDVEYNEFHIVTSISRK